MPLNIDFQQIFLHLLNFVILFAILYFLLYKPICQFIDKRKDEYKALDDRTNENLTHSEQIRQEYTSKLAAAREEAEQLRKTAEKEAAVFKEEQISAAKQEAQFILSNAQKAAKREGERITQEAQKELAELITTATKKVVQQANAQASFEQFLNAAEQEEEKQSGTRQSYESFLQAAEQVKEEHTNE